jgi:hypothetical protein
MRNYKLREGKEVVADEIFIYTIKRQLDSKEDEAILKITLSVHRSQIGS